MSGPNSNPPYVPGSNSNPPYVPGSNAPVADPSKISIAGLLGDTFSQPKAMHANSNVATAANQNNSNFPNQNLLVQAQGQTGTQPTIMSNVNQFPVPGSNQGKNSSSSKDYDLVTAENRLLKKRIKYLEERDRDLRAKTGKLEYELLEQKRSNSINSNNTNSGNLNMSSTNMNNNGGMGQNSNSMSQISFQGSSGQSQIIGNQFNQNQNPQIPGQGLGIMQQQKGGIQQQKGGMQQQMGSIQQQPIGMQQQPGCMHQQMFNMQQPNNSMLQNPGNMSSMSQFPGPQGMSMAAPPMQMQSSHYMHMCMQQNMGMPGMSLSMMSQMQPPMDNNFPMDAVQNDTLQRPTKDPAALEMERVKKNAASLYQSQKSADSNVSGPTKARTRGKLSEDLASKSRARALSEDLALETLATLDGDEDVNTTALAKNAIRMDGKFFGDTGLGTRCVSGPLRMRARAVLNRIGNFDKNFADLNAADRAKEVENCLGRDLFETFTEIVNETGDVAFITDFVADFVNLLLIDLPQFIMKRDRIRFRAGLDEQNQDMMDIDGEAAVTTNEDASRCPLFQPMVTAIVRTFHSCSLHIFLGKANENDNLRNSLLKCEGNLIESLLKFLRTVLICDVMSSENVESDYFSAVVKELIHVRSLKWIDIEALKNDTEMGTQCVGLESFDKRTSKQKSYVSKPRRRVGKICSRGSKSSNSERLGYVSTKVGTFGDASNYMPEVETSCSGVNAAAVVGPNSSSPGGPGGNQSDLIKLTSAKEQGGSAAPSFLEYIGRADFDREEAIRCLARCALHPNDNTIWSESTRKLISNLNKEHKNNGHGDNGFEIDGQDLVVDDAEDCPQWDPHGLVAAPAICLLMSSEVVTNLNTPLADAKTVAAKPWLSPNGGNDFVFGYHPFFGYGHFKRPRFDEVSRDISPAKLRLAYEIYVMQATYLNNQSSSENESGNNMTSGFPSHLAQERGLDYILLDSDNPLINYPENPILNYHQGLPGSTSDNSFACLTTFDRCKTTAYEADQYPAYLPVLCALKAVDLNNPDEIYRLQTLLELPTSSNHWQPLKHPFLLLFRDYHVENFISKLELLDLVCTDIPTYQKVYSSSAELFLLLSRMLVEEQPMLSQLRLKSNRKALLNNYRIAVLRLFANILQRLSEDPDAKALENLDLSLLNLSAIESVDVGTEVPKSYQAGESVMGDSQQVSIGIQLGRTMSETSYMGNPSNHPVPGHGTGLVGGDLSVVHETSFTGSCPDSSGLNNNGNDISIGPHLNLHSLDPLESASQQDSVLRRICLCTHRAVGEILFLAVEKNVNGNKDSELDCNLRVSLDLAELGICLIMWYANHYKQMSDEVIKKQKASVVNDDPDGKLKLNVSQSQGQGPQTSAGPMILPPDIALGKVMELVKALCLLLVDHKDLFQKHSKSIYVNSLYVQKLLVPHRVST